jgi:hypothetical protein
VSNVAQIAYPQVSTEELVSDTKMRIGVSEVLPRDRLRGVTNGSKHAGSRKAPRSARSRRTPNGPVAVYAAGITFAIVAWGYLVWAAIDFGATARGGVQGAWFFLVLACVGAACCLFAGLMLGMRLLTVLGVIAPPAGSPEAEARPVGGRRAAR